MYLSYTTNIKFTLVTDDEFQADNGNCKACDKVVQSYKRIIKIALKYIQNHYGDNYHTNQNTETQYKICLLFFKI